MTKKELAKNIVEMVKEIKASGEMNEEILFDCNVPVGKMYDNYNWERYLNNKFNKSQLIEIEKDMVKKINSLDNVCEVSESKGIVCNHEDNTIKFYEIEGLNKDLLEILYHIEGEIMDLDFDNSDYGVYTDEKSNKYMLINADYNDYWDFGDRIEEIYNNLVEEVAEVEEVEEQEQSKLEKRMMNMKKTSIYEEIIIIDRYMFKVQADVKDILKETSKLERGSVSVGAVADVIRLNDDPFVIDGYSSDDSKLSNLQKNELVKICIDYKDRLHRFGQYRDALLDALYAKEDKQQR